MVQTHIINPLTGRRITVGKSTYKRVMRLRDNILSLQQTTSKHIQGTKKRKQQLRELAKKKNKATTKQLLELYRQELQRDVKKKPSKPD